ncbi:MAG: acyltransferase family protein [Sedimentisphaerales bacterium]
MNKNIDKYHIAILAIIALHSVAGKMSIPKPEDPMWVIAVFINTFTRFAVPVFFMISGALILSAAETSNVTAFYKKTAFKLLLPVLIWEILYRLFFGYIYKVPAVYSIFSSNLGGLHLWFIWTLLGFYLIGPFLAIMVQNADKKQLFMLLIILLLLNNLSSSLNFMLNVKVPVPSVFSNVYSTTAANDRS